MIIRYSDKNISDIQLSPNTFLFDNSILSKIKNLADEVGAPEYTHTPQFYKKERNKQVISDKDWELIRNFKITKMVKKEGIDASVDVIRKYLNKMSTNTYEKLKDNIVSEISKICEINNINKLDTHKISCSDLIKIGNSIFTIASSSKFYSKMYAKLYSDLISEFNFMNYIFIENLNEFSKIFHDITYYDPKDYDNYCKNNKKMRIGEH